MLSNDDDDDDDISRTMGQNKMNQGTLKAMP
jgi:hypothetical protein